MIYFPIDHQVIGQSHILREAFAPCGGLALPSTSAPPPIVASSGKLPRFAIHVLLVSMDGGDVSSDDRPRVRISLAADSDDWGGDDSFGGATSLGSTKAAISRVGVVDEECSVCRWGRQRGENGGTAVSAQLGDNSGAGNLESKSLRSGFTWRPVRFPPREAMKILLVVLRACFKYILGI